MRVLYISQDLFPPYRADVAGLFGNHLSKRGYEIDWILQSEEPLGKEKIISDWNGGGVYVSRNVDGDGIISKIIRHWLAFVGESKMFTLARKKSYHAVLVKDKFLPALLAIIASRISRSVFIYWLSYPMPESHIYMAKTGVAKYPIISFVRGVISKFVLYSIIMKCARHIFVQSAQMVRDVSDEGIPISKLTAVPMGVEMSRIPSIDRFTEELGSQSIVYIGTLERARHIEFLIQVLAEVLKTYSDAVLYLVGKGETEDDVEFLKRVAIDLGVENHVRLVGFVPMPEVWDYVRGAAVCVSPFYPTKILNSTSPTKLIEYMAVGKPVVANDHPEQSLVIKESGAGICVRYDVEAFASAICELLSDSDRRREMGLRGREYVAHHRDYSVIADMVDTKLHEIVNAT